MEPNHQNNHRRLCVCEKSVCECQSWCGGSCLTQETQSDVQYSIGINQQMDRRYHLLDLYGSEDDIILPESHTVQYIRLLYVRTYVPTCHRTVSAASESS